MSYSHRTAWNGSDKQKHYNYVNWSAKHLMEDEDDVAEYFKCFQALSKPVLYLYGISRRECNELFWQGFHLDDHAMLFPHIIDRRPFWKPGPDFDFRELFNWIHAICHGLVTVSFVRSCMTSQHAQVGRSVSEKSEHLQWLEMWEILG